MKMTRTELNRAIAALREPEPAPIVSGWISKIPQTASHPEWMRNMPATEWIPRKDYLNNGNAALELLAEMPLMAVSRDKNNAYVVRYWEQDVFPSRATPHGEFCVAVALAWFQWKTGNRVELVDETEAHTEAHLDLDVAETN